MPPEQGDTQCPEHEGLGMAGMRDASCGAGKVFPMGCFKFSFLYTGPSMAKTMASSSRENTFPLFVSLKSAVQK